MGSRRLDISSLLCADQPHDSTPVVTEPVVLAPHLRNPALKDPTISRRPPSPPPTRLRSIPADADHTDSPRTGPPPRSIDTLIHPPSQQAPRHQHQHQHNQLQQHHHHHHQQHQQQQQQQQQLSQDPTYPPPQPRPSSSSSLPARSPAGSYAYPAVHSPTLSPLAQMSGLPAHSGYTSPGGQRSSSSPFYQSSQASPRLHRPPSSHAQLPQSQPRHTSVSHRSRSNTTSSASPTVGLYPLPQQQNKMAFAGLEALVHAATEEQKRLTAATLVEHGPQSPVLPSHHHQRHPPSRSPEDAYRTPQSIISPSLNQYPAVLPPPSHASRHDPRPTDDFHPRPSSSPYARPRQHYEDEQRQQLISQQERERELQMIEQHRLDLHQKEQKKLEQQRLEHQRILERQWEQRQREEEYREREKRIQEQQRQEEQERQRLMEQQRIESKRLQAQQLLVERRREQQRLQEEQQRLQEIERLRKEEEMEIHRRREEDERQRLEEERIHQLAEVERRRLEERRLIEERLAAEERRREEERQTGLRRREEEHRLEELRRREEERLIEEQRYREEERIMEEQRRLEEARRIEEQRLVEIEEQRLRRQREEHEQRQLQERLRAEQEAQERQATQRQQEARMSIDKPRSLHADDYRHPFAVVSAHPVTPQSVPVPAVIQLPQPIRPYPHITAPRKSDPIQIKRPADHGPPLHISTSAPSPSVEDQRPSKKQRYSESPPPTSTEPSYPRVVALPPPISIDSLPLRPGSSTVRRPGSGQGRKQVHVSLGDAVEREKERERERDRAPVDGHRIISPLGRRSPPGSQIGRATAAKKSDEARRADEAAAAAAIAEVRNMEETHPQVKKADDPTRPSVSPIRLEPRRVSQEHTQPVPKIEELTIRKSTDDTIRKTSLDILMNDETDVPFVKKESPQSTSFDSPLRTKEQFKGDVALQLPRDDRMKPISDVQSPTSKSRGVKDSKDRSQQEDPHEWIRDQLSPLEPPRSLSPSISPALAKTQPEKRIRTPPAETSKPVVALRSVSPDADAALERELAELMAEADEPAPVHKHEQEDDMDIDHFVAEILDEDDKSKVAPMEVDGQDDVGDELLSLVDDRPPAPPAAIRKVATPTIPTPPFKLSSLKTSTDDLKRNSPPAPAVSDTSPVATPPIVRHPSTHPGSDRASMPPPSAAPRGKEKEEESLKKGDAVSAKKKRDPGSKVGTKAKGATTASSDARTAASNNKQQKSKATATKKAKATDATTGSVVPTPTPMTETKIAAKHMKSSTVASKKSAAANNITASRSRSTSAMPTGSVDPEPERKSEEKEDEESEAVDDKLYCVCKTKYDEDRFMIACDRCDEWYHTACVNMPDLEVELVDQFFCPPCLERNPHLHLKTTYKQRCLNGLRHPDPDSPKACHKPARGAISKYCSDECGVKYMQSRIDAWAKKGGKKEELWENVKHAEKREGVAVCVDERIRTELDKKKKKQTKVDRETERLQGLLNQVVGMREEIKNSMEVLAWRERLLQLASERAEHIDQCGWDQRLCFGDEEWLDFGGGVLESYDDVKAMKDEVQEDGEEEGEWWCPGQKSCKRHNGWQTLRYKDICKEREMKEELLTKLTTRERQLRKRIEDLTDPSGRKPNDSTSHIPLKSSNTKLSNGHTKSKGMVETLKKGKKRKAPAS